MKTFLGNKFYKNINCCQMVQFYCRMVNKHLALAVQPQWFIKKRTQYQGNNKSIVVVIEGFNASPQIFSGESEFSWRFLH